MKPRYLIVIPVYNEEDLIGDVIRGLRKFAPTFDRVIVDDGSQDDRGAVVDALVEHSEERRIDDGL